MEGKVTLNKKEQKKLMVISEVERGEVGGREGAVLLGISLRHLRRLMAAYRQKGVMALAHGNRGRKPVNAIEDGVKRRVVDLASTRYAGFNHQHFTEFLNECESIDLSRSSVRSILLGSGIRSPRKRRPPKHRSRRERYPKEGMLLQIDGSPHDWLEGRGPSMSLIGAIDDATGRVPYALFQEEEDSRGYFLLLQGIVKDQGIPMALYHDRHSIFEVSPDKLPSIEEQLEAKTPVTQFGRLMEELGITSISAQSPQAKGRIERLWATFQDRLVSELRLAGVCTLEEANRVLTDFLPRYSERFGIPANQPGGAYRPTPEGFIPEEVFCFKDHRVVGADNVVRYKRQRLQVVPTNGRASYARCRVELQERLDGTLAVYYQGKALTTAPAPLEPCLVRTHAKTTDPVSTAVSASTLSCVPAKDHPWRRWVYRANRE